MNGCFTVCYLKSGQLQFLNIFSANKFATLCSGIIIILRLLNFITGTIQVTNGREYFPCRHAGHPCIKAGA